MANELNAEFPWKHTHAYATVTEIYPHRTYNIYAVNVMPVDVFNPLPGPGDYSRPVVGCSLLAPATIVAGL